MVQSGGGHEHQPRQYQQQADPQIHHGREEEEEEQEEEEPRIEEHNEETFRTFAGPRDDVTSSTEGGSSGERESEATSSRQVENNHLLRVSENVRHFRNFGIEGREASFRVRPLPEGANVYNWLENAFHELHSYAVRTGWEKERERESGGERKREGEIKRRQEGTRGRERNTAKR